MGDSVTVSYGVDFQFTAEPSQPIVGTVRGAGTGEPLAGVAVESYQTSGRPGRSLHALRAVTDERGRYRLSGMPKGRGNKLLAVPNDEQPYFMQEVAVPPKEGLGPITVDVRLHRGVWISGSVTDNETGKPVVGAHLHYYPFKTNKFAQSIPEFRDTVIFAHGSWYRNRYTSREDGSFRLVGLPGRGIVGVMYELVSSRGVYERPYRLGVGSDQIKGIQKNGYFLTWHSPFLPGKTWPNTMKEINPSEGTKSVVCDLQLHPND